MLGLKFLFIFTHIYICKVGFIRLYNTGYQEEDIDPDDLTTLQLVIGDKVLDENGSELSSHKYVFAPDGKKYCTAFNQKTFIFQLYRKKLIKTAMLQS